jgi:hypothetical protein
LVWLAREMERSTPKPDGRAGSALLPRLIPAVQCAETFRNPIHAQHATALRESAGHPRRDVKLFRNLNRIHSAPPSGIDINSNGLRHSSRYCVLFAWSIRKMNSGNILTASMVLAPFFFQHVTSAARYCA